jgi:hypothetical protein
MSQFPHYADQTLIHRDLVSVNAAGLQLLESQYVGDWNYLNLQALYGNANGVTGGYLVIRLTWTFDQDTYGISTGLGLRGQWQTVEYYTVFAPGLASNSYGHWCIPIKAPYVDIRVFRAGAFDVSYHFMAQLSMRKRPFRMANDNDPIFNGTSAGTAAGILQILNASVTGYGRAFISGYVYNSVAAGVYVLRCYEVNELGGGEEFFYVQTPPGSAANFVQNFQFEVPLRGRALSFQGIYGGGGVGNFKAFVTLFPED